MDDKNERNENEELESRSNPFLNVELYGAYLLTIGILFVITFIFTDFNSYWILGVLLLSIPYAFIGFCIWSFIKTKNRPIALGVLLGSLTPFIIIFVITGGCGFISL